MKTGVIFALILLTGSAALDDLYRGKISNGIIVTGLFWGLTYQVMAKGGVGLVCFLGGMLLPLILMAGLFYFRMIGAGDIKLFAVIGGFLGPAEVCGCLAVAVLLGALIALILMLRRHSFAARMSCLAAYLCAYSRERRWRSYLAQAGDGATFCFSVPVFLAVLWYVIRRGGIF